MSPSQLLNIIPTPNGVSLTIPKDVASQIDLHDERAADLLLLFDSELHEITDDALPIVWRHGNIIIRSFDRREATLAAASKFNDERDALRQQVQDEFKERLATLTERQRISLQNTGAGRESLKSQAKTI